MVGLESSQIGEKAVIEKVIADFREKLVDPLFADITRTLEVTCYKEGDENHGSNFIGNAVVLSGIETVAQFIDPTSKEKRQDFEKRSKEFCNTLDEKTKDLVTWKRSPREGSKLATDFMKEYFAPVFQERKEFGVPLYEVIWAFRNRHMHGFYPYDQKMFNGKKVSGAVGWLYKDPANGIGITIKEVEDDFDAWKQKLYKKGVDWFRFCHSFGICPQVLFVYLKQAVEKLLAEVCSNADVWEGFYENYKRLAKHYKFMTEP